MTTEASDSVFFKSNLENESISKINELLENSLRLSFSVEGKIFSAKPMFYEEQTTFEGKNSVGIIFEILNEKQEKTGEVVGYIYSQDGKKYFLVQYSENKSGFTDMHVRGLIRAFSKELLLSGKIDVWVSSADLNQNSTAMYQKIAADDRFSVTYAQGNDFRDQENSSFKVELSDY